MHLTEIQDEIIAAAHSEGRVAPVTFAHLLLHDLDQVHAAISDLVDSGLVVAAGGDAYRLTEHGEAVHRAGEVAHRAAVVSGTRMWQRS